MSIVLDKIGVKKVIGICTDNGSNMRAAWSLIELKYSIANPILTCYACAAHTLNLLFKNVFEKTESNNILTASKEIISEIRGKKVINAHFDAIRSKHQVAETIKLPVPTRFSSQYPSLNSLKVNRTALTDLAIDPKHREKLDGNVRKNILSDSYWRKIDDLLVLLKPIKNWITMLEGDQPNIAEVVEAFYEIETTFDEQLAENFLRRHKLDLMRCVADRREMCVNTLHLAANLLDPKLKGSFIVMIEYTIYVSVCLCFGKLVTVVGSF